jgi:hypothetical protein
MTTNSYQKPSYQKPSQETQDAAMKIARATQRQGQSKEQTKLIAQGIQKGIEHYKKQQKAKYRELDKKRKRGLMRQEQLEPDNQQEHEIVVVKQHWLPWLLLVITWLGIGVYFLAEKFS